MSVPGWLILNVYVLIILIMLLSITHRKRVSTVRDRSFTFLLRIILILLIADSFSRARIFGEGGLWISKVGTYVIYAGDPVGYLAALLYIDSWTAGRKDHKEKLLYGIVHGYVLLNFLLVTVSALFHLNWFYYFQGSTYYHGRLYVARGLLNMIFCAVVCLYIFLRRQQIRTQYKAVIILFPLIILLSGFLQVFIGGAAYEYAGAVFACLLLFLKVQAHHVDDDYLTGLLNRRGFTSELEYQCAHYREDHPFLVYLIDIDFFKEINDQHGHLAGDAALVEMAGLLMETFGKEARIGRYGGDEFILLSFEKDTEQAQKKLDELRKKCQKFNQDHAFAYPLSFSAGFAFYNPDTYSDVEQFFHHIDGLMYREKKSHHALRNVRPS